MPKGFFGRQDSRFPRVSFEAGLIFFIALLLSAIGLIIQTSAGQYHNSREPLYTAYMQTLYLLPALLSYFVFSRVDLEYFRKYVWWIFGGSLLLLLLIYVPGFGKEVNGSRRWVDLGFFNLQVSDPAKLALVFVLSHCIACSRRYFLPAQFKWFRRSRCWRLPTREMMTDCFRGFLIPSGIIGLVCFGVVIEPDFGTAILCAAVGFAMLFLAGGRWHYFAVFTIPGAIASVGGCLLIQIFSPDIWDNRARRFLSFWDPEGFRGDESFQLWHALVGIASGEFDGKGLGNGMIYRGFLPEAHTDCVFAVVGEEFGFCGAVLIPVLFLLFFGLVISQLKKIADDFYFNICLGSGLFICVQALVNLFVNLGLAPTKGMSLPFISYGGSNLVVMFAFVGMISNSIRNWQRSVIPQPSEF